MLAEHLGGRRIVLGRHDDQRATIIPFAREGQHFVRPRLLAVDQDRVRAGPAVGLPAAQRLFQAPAGDQGFDPSHDAEIVVLLRVLAGLDLAAKGLDVFQFLLLALDETVGFREQLVLDADAADVALLELAHQAPHVVEIAVTGVAVEQDRDGGGIRHELENADDLGPAQLVVVAHRVLRRQGQPGTPDALEAGFLDNSGRQTVVGFENELGPVGLQQVPELSRLAGGFMVSRQKSG